MKFKPPIHQFFTPAVRAPEPWHDVEYIKAVSPDGIKFRLAYHFYGGLMRVWMFGCTQHTPQYLRDAGWQLTMPMNARRN